MSSTMTTTGKSDEIQATNKTEYESVKTHLNYYLDPSRGGITWYTPGTAMTVRRKFENHPVNIYDMRGHESDFDINIHSFQPCKFTTAAKELTDEQIKEVMYPEVTSLVQKV